MTEQNDGRGYNADDLAEAYRRKAWEQAEARCSQQIERGVKAFRALAWAEAEVESVRAAIFAEIGGDPSREAMTVIKAQADGIGPAEAILSGIPRRADSIRRAKR